MLFSCWFRQCQRGIFVEEFFKHELEVRVAAIFGRVVVGATDCGLRIGRDGQSTRHSDAGVDWNMKLISKNFFPNSTRLCSSLMKWKIEKIPSPFLSRLPWQRERKSITQEFQSWLDPVNVANDCGMDRKDCVRHGLLACRLFRAGKWLTYCAKSVHSANFYLAGWQ